MKISKIFYKKELPQKLGSGIDFQNCVLVFDQILAQKYSNWILLFPKRLSVQSGETLKELKNFSNYMEKILELTTGISKEKLTVVSFGGGSVGDFSGFVASILKRGVSLVHIPSTWLSAMDSAHGGKTALNIGAIKNQIGTYYSADSVYLVKGVLLAQPEERLVESAGEYYKMGLLTGGALWKSCLKSSTLSKEQLWKDLPKVVDAKIKIVKQDPYEKKGLRHILNLGHTVGHVLESQLGLPHGVAVHLGIRFSLEWGKRKKINGRKYKEISIPEGILPSALDLKKYLQKVSNPKAILILDKKALDTNSIRFVFLKKPGHPIVQKVKIEDLLKEWELQKC